MKHLIIALAASAILMTSAMAQKIGVTLSAFEHQFLVNVREAMDGKGKGDGSADPIRRGPGGYRQAA